VDDIGRSSGLALLERAKAGDKDAFGILAEEHRAALLRLCEKMTGSPETAEDLVQETLLKAYTHIAEFELRASMRTWLYRIATNACLEHQRGRKPWDIDKRWQWFRDNGELVQQMEQQLYLSPERSAEVKEVAATCINCVTMSLPAKQRAAIVLCDQAGLSRDEAAKAIGASVASVKTELHRARKKMTDVFEHHCQLVDGQNECNGCLVAGRIQRRGASKAIAAATEARRADTRTKAANAAAAVSAGGALSCDEIDELLSDLLAGELPHTTAAGVQAHLASCERCAASYKAMKRTVRFVRAHQDVRLTPGTPGGNYMEFSRALVELADETPEQVIERTTGFRPGRSKS
jgi:RNA polymerase sigma factor (sigma-70 family)